VLPASAAGLAAALGRSPPTYLSLAEQAQLWGPDRAALRPGPDLGGLDRGEPEFSSRDWVAGPAAAGVQGISFGIQDAIQVQAAVKPDVCRVESACARRWAWMREAGFER